ncbi:hypothetical protein MUP05_06365 [Candidatus Bathyarchaeota archaeon]|nr:hypothetical protein [Candidatus Bathyarchaeota archaeon]
MGQERLCEILGTAGSIWFSVSLFLFIVSPSDRLSLFWMINIAVGTVFFLLAGVWKKRLRKTTS